jgi:hypothetical protein
MEGYGSVQIMMDPYPFSHNTGWHICQPFFIGNTFLKKIEKKNILASSYFSYLFSFALLFFFLLHLHNRYSDVIPGGKRCYFVVFVSSVLLYVCLTSMPAPPLPPPTLAVLAPLSAKEPVFRIPRGSESIILILGQIRSGSNQDWDVRNKVNNKI